MVNTRLAVSSDSAVRERYRWVANRGEEAVFTTTALFLGCTSSDWIGGLCRSSRGAGDRGRHWIEAGSAAIRAAFKVRRLPSCAVPQACVSFISFTFCSTGPSCHLFIHSLLQRHLYRISSINAAAEAAEQAIFDSDAAVPFTRAYIAAGRAIISHTFAYTHDS
jgi:hypothetical protein